MALSTLFQVVVISILVKPQLAEMAALGEYVGWDQYYRFYCKMTVKSSPEMQIVADVELERGFNRATCVDCNFVYGLSNGFGNNRSRGISGDPLYQFGFTPPPTDPTTACLNQLAEIIGVGGDCRWDAYAKYGGMVLDGCGAHWELVHVK
ncbi:hypothetical protein FOL47_002822 [Perkinsus chesapeaki]|uniref:Uncharacterized protein n=1 Tax=Perkinsus chesapeaki TaxID=330153 RepID=A0A7J6MBK6_PERCH|nr:hypothetical protein FOL47_002822 [Perkinsus chesapeaki]